MKKSISTILMLAMMIAAPVFTACGGGDDSDDDNIASEDSKGTVKGFETNLIGKWELYSHSGREKFDLTFLDAKESIVFNKDGSYAAYTTNNVELAGGSWKIEEMDVDTKLGDPQYRGKVSLTLSYYTEFAYNYYYDCYKEEYERYGSLPNAQPFYSYEEFKELADKEMLGTQLVLSIDVLYHNYMRIEGIKYIYNSGKTETRNRLGELNKVD